MPEGFGARLRRLRNKRYEDWWHIVFGGPIGVFLAALIAPIQWITPNGLTWAAFTCKLAGAGLLLADDFRADLAVVALLNLNIILDIMDGSLARYRKKPSATGAFLDKVTDGLGLLALGTCLGVRAHHEGAGVLTLVAGGFIGGSYLARCYMYWLVAFLEKDRGVAVATTGPSTIKPFGELGLGERLAYYVKSTWRVILVGEGDIYFWVSLFLLLGRVEWVVLPLGGAMAFWLVAYFGKRFATVVGMDRDAAAAAAGASGAKSADPGHD
ncbi:MAG: CDP-alcohol phosphatidyltransferase family protein [Deltaproteobacteria bacterium]|nr:CDP-alcohol phosphatidyltransferase family protein [Deltaproteobacteria bacterium]